MLFLVLLFFSFSCDSDGMLIESSVSSAIDALPEAAAKRALVGMKSFYRAVIKDLQRMMPIEDTLLNALTCLNTKEQIGYTSLQHCRVVASKMLSVPPEEEVAGDEWIRYQEFEVTDDNLKLRINKFWHKIFSWTDASGEHFVISPNCQMCFSTLPF